VITVSIIYTIINSYADIIFPDYPGDVGFDPLNFKPEDPAAFANMQTRELQNGRLAMLAWAGMCAQELVNHRSIFETFDFYSKIYSGVNPYESCGEGYIC